jgi:putative CRISPR-associated protein (TIGR02619 family)
MTPQGKAKASGERRFLHIVPVGTSILVNRGWKNGDALPAKGDVLIWLRESPRERSAELNGLLWFAEKGECTAVHLVATDTPACRLCRDVLADFFVGRNIPTTGKGAEAQDMLPASFEEARDHASFYAAVRGLRELIFRVAAGAKKRGEEVLINATPGLKSEVAVAALVAAELSIKAYYVHQSMTETVFLPTAAADPNAIDLLGRLSRGYSRSRLRKVPPDQIEKLEQEGLITISRKQDGEISNVKLTEYGKHILKRRPK